MTSWKPLAAAVLSISTGACASSGLSLSSRPPIVIQSPPVIPPVECQQPPPARVTFQPPTLQPQVQTGTALAIAVSRAERAEAVAMATLDYIDNDRVRDADVDDVMRRCAVFNRGVADAPH